MACTKETIIIVEVPAEESADDTDGDGVKNSIEETDGTDPEAPCSYLETQQKFKETTVFWRNSDCDGDGVTNGNEIDPDGNNTNNGNGTNPRDKCDFVLSQQTISPSQEWYNADCDGDCVSNAQELADNTDPNNGDSYLGNGTTLTQIIYANRSLTFAENGMQIVEILDLQGNTVSTFNYSNNNLASAQITTFNRELDFSFTYQNNKLSSISKTIDGIITVSNMEYVGNQIIMHDADEPPNLFRIRLTFNANSRLISREKITAFNNSWGRKFDSFFYDSDGLLSSVEINYDGYDPITGMFYDTNGEVAGATFSYHQEVNNPLQPAMELLRIQSFLEPDLLYAISLSDDALYALFETKYLLNFYYGTSGTNYSYTQQVDCTNDQNNPTRGKIFSRFGDPSISTFIYE